MDDRYPDAPKGKGRWILCEFLHLRWPDAMAVVGGEHMAWIREHEGVWDAVTSLNVAERFCRHRLPSEAWARETEAEDAELGFASDFWREYVPDGERGYLKVAKAVPFDRVIAIDPLGDGHYPVPHVLVEWAPKVGPFAKGAVSWLEHLDSTFRRSEVEPKTETRAQLFPVPLPKELFPPPPTLDYKAPESELSPGGASSLDSLLTKVREKAAEMVALRSRPMTPLENTNLLAFRKWRDEVAAPTLGGLVKRLRDSAHDARIRVTSNSGQETIELRVRLNVGGSFANPNYHPEGHVRFATAFHRPIEVEAWPSPSGGSPRREYGNAAPTPALSDFSKERVEREVLEMLGRIQV